MNNHFLRFFSPYSMFMKNYEIIKLGELFALVFCEVVKIGN